MKDTSSKRIARIEKKKKKMAALLEITKLNENDRAVKNAKLEAANASCNGTDLEPSPKRQRTEPAKSEVLLWQPAEPDQHQQTQLITGQSGKPKLYGEELAELKRLLREKSNKMKQHPLLRLREVGDSASLKVDFDNRVPLFMSDLQHLIMYSQVGVHSPYSPAKWCALEKYNRLASTTLLIVENVSMFDFVAYESKFDFTRNNFEHKLEMLTSGAYKGDIVRDLSMVPLTGTQMRKFIGEFGSLENAVIKSNDIFDMVKNLFPIEDAPSEPTQSDLPPTDKFSRRQLLLSGWQLVEENFPLPIKGLAERKYVGYVLTKDKYKPVTSHSPMFGMDCEMCRTTTGDLELTRISVVNERCEVFYDTLVKPKNRIVDYLTKFSGITAKMMKNVNKTLEDVQNDLRRMLPGDAILVGQSLSNDMHALKMMHPYVIDTSVIFNITGDRSRKTKLQTLAREFLSERIQESRKGHCSTEDSVACVKLTKLKLTKSVYFGDAVMESFRNQVRAYPDLGTSDYATSMLKQATKGDKKALVVSTGEIGEKYKFYVNKGEDVEGSSIRCVTVKSNKEVVKQLRETGREYSLCIGHLRISEKQLSGEKDAVFETVDEWVKEVYEQTLAPGLVCVLFGGNGKGGNGCCFLQMKRALM